MSILRRFFPKPPPVTVPEKIFAGFSAFLAITLIWLIKDRFPLHFNDTLLASMGATAVLLYATPHSPMVQPYSILGGHLVSALVGVLAQQWVPLPYAAGVAVGGAIIAMHLSGCLHPPGGATALYAVSGGAPVWALEYDYILRPVATSASLMLLIGLLINNCRSRHTRYPAPLKAPAVAMQAQVSGPKTTREDIRRALLESGTYIDVDDEDLWVLYQKADLIAHDRFFSHHAVSDLPLEPPATIFSAAPLSEVWQKLLASKKDCLIVVDGTQRIMGIITSTDAVKRLTQADAQGRPPFQEEGTAARVMTHPVQTLLESASLSEAARQLAKGQIHHVPVVDREGNLTGVITHADLWSLLKNASV